ncbi:toll-like receptor 13 [Centropristis striata]|uniref:toll-like receptor 13 n=1 Tax=Centropristis striata TaxID=184440 RepID=UPI0027E1A84C|nr:toll-like receptor 13 [Centropristis striata]
MRRLVFLLSVLLQVNPSLPYSLKHCTVSSSSFVPGLSVTCADRQLAAVPDDIPKKTISLNLANNQIRGINSSALNGFSKLLKLKMSSNSMWSIEDGSFADLAALTDLDLSYNNLTNLTDDMFQGLSRLARLHLNENGIRCVSALAFRPLVRLQAVNLTSNYLRHIAHIVPILQLINLFRLEAGENRFASLDSDDLPFNKSDLRTFVFGMKSLTKVSIKRDVFPRLQSLRFSECSPEFEWHVPNKTFLRSLTTLYLSGTVTSFETFRMIVQSAESVVYLRLSGMERYFDKGLISTSCRIPALKRLDLSSNLIYALNDTLLQPCSQITELTLVDNALTDLSENSLKPLNRLVTLQVGFNLLTRVPRALRSLSTLTVLELNTNDIKEIGCSDFLNLTTLKYLTLAQNRITTLRGCEFQALKDLRVLVIRGNPLVRIYEAFSISLHNLRVLNMSFSLMPKLFKGIFRALSSLVFLNAESVDDAIVYNGTFEGLDRLQVLVLHAESLREDMLRGLTHLQNLTLSFPDPDKSLSRQFNTEPPILNVPSLRLLTIKNQYRWDTVSPYLLRDMKYLEYFAAENFFPGTPHPDTFTSTPRLTRLRIFGSEVSHLKPELFQPIPNLQLLDLSKNKLTSLDFLSQVNLSALSSLTLVKNQLTVIDESVFQSLPALTYLDLSGNPFTCDCSNAGFIQWAKNNNQTLVDNGHQYDCAFPAAQQGRKLLDFDVQSCWTDYGFLCFVSSTCLTLLTLLTSFTYHFLRWQLAYTFHLFLAFLYDSRKRKKGAAHQYDAFISYNVHDEAWVYREMLPVLEGEQGWRLCLHHRDFQPGKPIVENITDAIYGSRKTICVISWRYLQSEWCSREIQMASFRLFDEQKDVLILLFLEDIPARQLSPYHRMRKLVKRRTYLSWPLAGRHTGVFWQNVQRALETGDAPTETIDR